MIVHIHSVGVKEIMPQNNEEVLDKWPHEIRSLWPWLIRRLKFLCYKKEILYIAII